MASTLGIPSSPSSHCWGPPTGTLRGGGGAASCSPSSSLRLREEGRENLNSLSSSSSLPNAFLSVPSMVCRKYCARVVHSALSEVPGVLDVRVDFERRLAIVSGSAREEALVFAVRSVGFEAFPLSPSSSFSSLSPPLSSSPSSSLSSSSGGRWEREEERMERRGERGGEGEERVQFAVEGIIASLCAEKVKTVLSTAPAVLHCMVDAYHSLVTLTVACHQAANLLALQHAIQAGGPCALKQNFKLKPLLKDEEEERRGGSLLSSSPFSASSSSSLAPLPLGGTLEERKAGDEDGGEGEREKREREKEMLSEGELIKEKERFVSSSLSPPPKEVVEEREQRETEKERPPPPPETGEEPNKEKENNRTSSLLSPSPHPSLLSSRLPTLSLPALEAMEEPNEDSEVGAFLQVATPRARKERGEREEETRAAVEKKQEANSAKKKREIVELALEGITCSACVETISGALERLPGVHKSQVFLLSHTATVEYDPTLCSSLSLLDAVSAVGYDGEVLKVTRPSTETAEHDDKEREREKRRTATGSLRIEGMTCSSCSNTIEKGLKATPGVLSAAVNLSTEKAQIVFEREKISLKKLAEVVNDLGYEAFIDEEEGGEDEGERWWKGEERGLKGEEKGNGTKETRSIAREKGYRRQFLLSFYLSIPIWLITLVRSSSSSAKDGLERETIPGLSIDALLLLPFATVIQFYCGRDFYRSAWKGLRHRSVGMAVLVVLGTSAAYLYAAGSIIAGIIMGDPSQADTMMLFDSATVITFILLGKYLETIAKHRTTSAIAELTRIQSKTAILVDRTTGREEEVSVDVLTPGDVVKVLRGSSVPADGVVVEGTGEVDESMLTGEFAPVVKGPESRVIGGTVAVEGLFFVQVDRVGADTTLAQVIRLVESAQLSKPPIQEVADKISSVFVPIIVLVALCSFSLWLSLSLSGVVPSEWKHGESDFLFSLMFAVSTLVVACPCALGLAAPTAMMVGTGVGARLGILIKGGAPLQKAQEISTIIFDKTGTLTRGMPVVLEWLPSKEEEKAEREETPSYRLPPAVSSSSPSSSSSKPYPSSFSPLLYFAAVERNSEHPIARAIVKYVDSVVLDGLSSSDALGTASNFQATSGRGVACTVGGRAILIGNRSFLESQGVVIASSAAAAAERERQEAMGCTVVYCAIDGVFSGVFVIADELRPEASDTVSRLQEQGISVRILTGDNRRAALHVAGRLGIPEDRVDAEMLPEGKIRRVEELQEAGEVVAMVGDGINDSPSLVKADLGIAIGAGTQVAMEAAGLVLMKSNLQDIITALDLSRVVYRRIWWNFFGAFAYNVALIPFAAGIWFPLTEFALPPWASGLAMALSSVTVVLFSLQLNFYRPPHKRGWWWRKWCWGKREEKQRRDRASSARV